MCFQSTSVMSSINFNYYDVNVGVYYLLLFYYYFLIIYFLFII